MTILNKIYNRKLHLALLLSLAVHAPMYAETTIENQTIVTESGNNQSGSTLNIEEITQAAEDAAFAEEHEKLRTILDASICTLDTTTQIQANRAHLQNIPQNKQAQELVKLIRAGISDFKDSQALYKNKEQVLVMTAFTLQITGIVDAIATHGPEVLVSKTRGFTPKKHTPITSETTLKELQKITKTLEKEIALTVRKADELGLSGINKAYRKASKFWTQHSLGPIAERLFMYPAIFIWIVYCSDSDQIDAFPLPKSWNERIKIAKEGVKKPGSKTEGTAADMPRKAIIVDSIEEGFRNPLPNDIVTLYPRDKTTRRPDLLKGFDVPYQEAYKTAQKTNPTLTEAEFKDNYIIELTDSVKTGYKGASQVSQEKNSFIGNAQYGLAAVIRWATDKPLFEIAIHTAAAAYVLNDIKTLYGQALKAKAVLHDKLSGNMKQAKFEATVNGSDRFKNVVGREEIKSELRRVIDYVVNPEKYDRANITVEKGFLFTGPSQNGKSAMIEAFMNELRDALAAAGKTSDIGFLPIKISEIFSTNSPLGGQKNPGLEFYTQMAKLYGKPVVIVVDEIDMLCLQRDRDAKMLADFLTSMSSGLSASEKNMTIVIGLTNKPQNIDFALRQNGRFGKIFRFNKPTYKDRLQFFVKECERHSIDPQRFNLDKLAQETEGVSYGTLLALVKRAFTNAKLECVGISQRHFELALDTEVKKILFDKEEAPLDRQKILAVHNAGKALVSYVLKPQKQLCKVTILACTQEVQEEHVHQSYNFDKTPVFKTKEQTVERYGNIFAYSLTDTLDMETDREITMQAKILVAGNVAQKVSDLQEHSFDKSDKEEAFALARRVAFEGLEQLQGMSKKAQEELLEKAVQVLLAYEADVAKLLTTHKKALVALSAALLEKKTLTGDEVAAIVEANK